MELKLQRRTRDGWTDVEDHLALGPLQRVNPFMSSSELLLATQAFLELSSDTFMPYGKVVKKPLEIWPLDPSRTHVVRHQTRFIGGYVYKHEKGENVPLRTEEVLHFKRFNPRNRYRRIGTVQAAAISIKIEGMGTPLLAEYLTNTDRLLPQFIAIDGNTLDEQENQRKIALQQGYESVRLVESNQTLVRIRSSPSGWWCDLCDTLSATTLRQGRDSQEGTMEFEVEYCSV